MKYDIHVLFSSAIFFYFASKLGWITEAGFLFAYLLVCSFKAYDMIEALTASSRSESLREHYEKKNGAFSSPVASTLFTVVTYMIVWPFVEANQLIRGQR